MVYDQVELDRINKNKEANDRMEEFLSNERKKWDEELKPVFETVKCDFNNDNARKIMDVQSNALAFRQNISEQISFYLNKRSREDVKLKKARQDKFLWYATNFGVKTNMGEKSLLIDAHVAEMERAIELLDVNIEYLRSTSKNLESLQFLIKNVIELYNYLSKN